MKYGVPLISLIMLIDVALIVRDINFFLTSADDGKTKFNSAEIFLAVFYFLISLPCFYAPFLYGSFSLGCLKDNSVTRVKLRRICFYVNIAQLVKLIFIVMAQVSFDVYHKDHDFLLALGTQIVAFLLYVYCQGLMNRFARTKLDEEVAEIDKSRSVKADE